MFSLEEHNSEPAVLKKETVTTENAEIMQVRGADNSEVQD